MLCILCDNLSLELMNREGYHHAPSHSALDDSAKNGCELCLLLQNALGRGTAMPSNLFPDSVFGRALAQIGRREGVWLLWNRDVNRGVRVALRRERGGLMEDQFGQLHMFVAPESPLSDEIKGRQVHPSSDSPGALALMHSWIKDCIQNHPGLPKDSRLCQDLTEDFEMRGASLSLLEGPLNGHSSPLPTRIIDIGPSDGSQPPRLYEPKEGSFAHYVALSHCWGHSKPLITTTMNLTARLEQISENDLPKTFRDAIFITRKIGIRYLWIDSLCILQDSAEDWRHEAALMGQYYSKSFLTISAAGSPSSEKGCFISRSTDSQPVRLNLKQTRLLITKTRGCLPCLSTRISSESIQIQLEGGSDVYMAESDFQIPFMHPEVADSRAWILQEIALSPRVILFGEKMLAWLCNTKHCTERGDDVLHETSSHYVMAPRLPHHLRHAVDYKVTDIAWMMAERWVTMEASTWWAKMVQNYSTRNLTVEKDKFPALSGCARAIQALNKDAYFAGLWKRTLKNDLLWQSVEGKTASRPKDYRAPSWSWASINGEVKCCITGKYDTLGKKLVADLSIESEYLSPDTFGELKTMSLFLEGSPARVKVQDQNLNEATEWATGNRVCTLVAIDPSCSCSNCVASTQGLEVLARDLGVTSTSDEITNPPMSNTLSGVGQTDIYVPHQQTTIRYTGLEASEMGNSGPQYTQGDFSINQSSDLIGRHILEHFGTQNAGSAIFDVESEIGAASDDSLWCLPINPQFGLLLVRDGPSNTAETEVPKYRRVGVVKLSLSWKPVHTMTKLAIV